MYMQSKLCTPDSQQAIAELRQIYCSDGAVIEFLNDWSWRITIMAEEIKERKRELRENMIKTLAELSEEELSEKRKKIEDRVFDFANFKEARVPLLYLNYGSEVPTRIILEKCLEQDKIVILPAFSKEKYRITPMKIDDLEADMKPGPRGIPEPDPDKCRMVPVDRLDIAIIPGIAFDEKGARIGSGFGYYDRLIPKLPITTRKVALAFENQIVQQVPMQSHDKHVDIIITDERIIYKI
ncbi:5-formyltetrahydrofolate cyclo-ligase [Desulfobacterales bacterium HSG2]|nr:5-formyltetrahydrofolate cyclo-ligase [Desulfobacterales bacterium HSG2]